MPHALEQLIGKNNIPGLSMASISPDGEIVSQSAGVTDQNATEPQPVNNTTMFAAASLTKPVFAYIVLKMIERGEFSRPGETPVSGLDRPLYEICDFGPPHLRADPNYKLLTARNILSHQAGLPNWFKPGETEAYAATAETRFDYSGLAYCCLNEVVEHITGKPLHELSQEVFDEQHLQMSHTSFVPYPEGFAEEKNRAIGHTANGTAVPPPMGPPPQPILANPAASLGTTGEDYAKFLNACLHDEFIRTHMFAPQISLAGKDHKAIDANVSPKTLQQMSWGLGIGLQTAANGDTIAFHWGDNEIYRAFTAINLQTDKAAVCFTNSANGPAIFRQLVEPVVGDIQGISEWLSNRENLNIQRITDLPETPVDPKTTLDYKAHLMQMKQSTSETKTTDLDQADDTQSKPTTPFKTTLTPPGEE